MKLGLLTAAFPTLTLDEIADWAADNGFETLEVACWPAGEGAGGCCAQVAHGVSLSVARPTTTGMAPVNGDGVGSSSGRTIVPTPSEVKISTSTE